MNDFNGYDKYRYDDYTVFGRVSSPEEHFVEDARTFPSLDAPKEPQTKKAKPRGKGRGILITVMITILCFSITLFAADFLSGHSGIAEYAALFTRSKKDEATYYYAVYAAKSEDMGIAYKNAGVIRSEGGAGYVMKSGKEYYVILNAYASKEDAESVAKKQANYQIIEIRIPSFDLKKAKSLAPAEDSKDLYRESYLFLYQAANDLASGKYAEEDMKRALNREKETILAKETAYAENIRGQEDSVLIEYKVLLAEIRSAYENLTSGSDRLVSDARYYSVMILHSYSLFAQKHFD